MWQSFKMKNKFGNKDSIPTVHSYPCPSVPVSQWQLASPAQVHLRDGETISYKWVCSPALLREPFTLSLTPFLFQNLVMLITSG